MRFIQQAANRGSCSSGKAAIPLRLMLRYRSSTNSLEQPANTAVSNAWYSVIGTYRFHSKHLPEIELGTGGRKRIESVVILECSSLYYHSKDPQTYDPLLDLCVTSICGPSLVH